MVREPVGDKKKSLWSSLLLDVAKCPALLPVRTRNETETSPWSRRPLMWVSGEGVEQGWEGRGSTEVVGEGKGLQTLEAPMPDFLLFPSPSPPRKSLSKLLHWLGSKGDCYILFPHPR